MHGSMSECGGLKVVRDHENCLIQPLIQVAQYFENRQRVARIEISRRLVRQQDPGFCGQRARDRYALLLSARHLGRFMIEPPRDAQ